MYNKDYIKGFLFITVLLILVFTKGEFIQYYLQGIKEGDITFLVAGTIGILSALAGWVYLAYNTFFKK